MDNSVGTISGFFAVIGGAIGLGFCCEKQNKTASDHNLRAFLAFCILGFVTSFGAVIVNLNCGLYYSYFLTGDGKYLKRTFN